MYCNNIEELVAIVLHHRSQETSDVDIKLGVGGGRGFLKVKPELENKTSEKSSKCDKYVCKHFKESSAHKTIILAILPSLTKNTLICG